MATVGIRALKQNASEVVRRAAAGDVITVTDRGRPVARIVPIRATPLEEMRSAGLVREATRKPWDLPMPTGAAAPGEATLGEVLHQMREDERY